jgi:hypothetical protein
MVRTLSGWKACIFRPPADQSSDLLTLISVGMSGSVGADTMSVRRVILIGPRASCALIRAIVACKS